MSNLDRAPGLTHCGGLADVATRPVHELFAGREVQLGTGTTVRRLLPNLGRRLVGPWCFVDHYGPVPVPTTPAGTAVDDPDAPGMQVPPHPHCGLQTVSWLLDGEVHHRDSIGSDQLIRPGALGLMTSGQGIAHAERSPAVHSDSLHGVQLWVALPDHARTVAPTWQHHVNLPVVNDGGLTATVIMGELDGAASPGHAYSPLFGADLALAADSSGALPLEPGFEYALLAMAGSVEIENTTLDVGSMLYLGCGRSELRLRADGPARVLLLGGVPFEEQIVMWWNFVARSNEEIVAAREQWMDGSGSGDPGSGSSRFGRVSGAGRPLLAPPLPPGRLKPGGSVR